MCCCIQKEGAETGIFPEMCLSLGYLLNNVQSDTSLQAAFTRYVRLKIREGVGAIGERTNLANGGGHLHGSIRDGKDLNCQNCRKGRDWMSSLPRNTDKFHCPKIGRNEFE